jgi:iron complex transport system permease protein
MRSLPYLCCGLTLLLAFLLSLCLGAVDIPTLDIARMLLSRLPLMRIEPSWIKDSETILFEIRLPDAALLAITGAALAGSGAAYQGLFRNPLADPYLIGVAAGAGLGAVVAMVSGWPTGAVPAAALVGALATVGAVYALARVGRTAPVTTLILSGVAVGAFAHALTAYLMIQKDLELRRVFNFLLGGFRQGGWTPVLAALPYIFPGLLALWALGRSLNVLQFGDEQASQLGLDVEKAKLCIIIASSLAAAAAVASMGIIGFVGLVAPHLIRLLWGPDFRRLIPLSVLAGAAMLLLADTAGRAARTLHELPVGIITALVGAPFFLFLLRRVRKSYW